MKISTGFCENILKVNKPRLMGSSRWWNRQTHLRAQNPNPVCSNGREDGLVSPGLWSTFGTEGSGRSDSTPLRPWRNWRIPRRCLLLGSERLCRLWRERRDRCDFARRRCRSIIEMWMMWRAPKKLEGSHTRVKSQHWSWFLRVNFKCRRGWNLHGRQKQFSRLAIL